MPRKIAPEICPICSEEVPASALACPECGADHRSGWREDAENTGGLDLPDENFQYEEWVKEEFGAAHRPSKLKLIWWLAAILLLIILGALYLYDVFQLI